MGENSLEQDHNEEPEAFRILTEEECWEKLVQHTVGRLVTHVGEVIDIVPINYVADNKTIVFRTAPGRKLLELSIHPKVLFEVDQYDEERGWSVVVRGKAIQIEHADDIAATEQLDLKPLVATFKPNFVRIHPTSLTGREFIFGPEPELDSFQPG